MQLPTLKTLHWGFIALRIKSGLLSMATRPCHFLSLPSSPTSCYSVHCTRSNTSLRKCPRTPVSFLSQDLCTAAPMFRPSPPGPSLTGPSISLNVGENPFLGSSLTTLLESLNYQSPRLLLALTTAAVPLLAGRALFLLCPGPTSPPTRRRVVAQCDKVR